jgi:outer membrane protein TolC
MSATASGEGAGRQGAGAGRQPPARTPLAVVGVLALLLAPVAVVAQQAGVLPPAEPATKPTPPTVPAQPCDRPLPINLPTALKLANVRPLDIALASQRLRLAAVDLQRANVLWLPSIYLGVDYFRHDGQIQDVAGNVFGTSKSSFMAGAAPFAVFALSDAIFEPLAARQVVRARQAQVQATTNDTLLAVAEAYFNVQQARGELAGAEDAARRAEELVRRAENLAAGLVPPVEVSRARTELARRRQALYAARERWRTASAELARILRLDPRCLVEPLEPPQLKVDLVCPERPVDELITMALTNRPELAAQQALVRATLERLRQERLRPLVPSILLRGASTSVTGTLAAGVFGGGVNDNVGKFSMRSDWDVQVLWQLDNLGFGNHARVDQRRAEHEVAVLETFRTQDRVAAEVVQALAQVQSAAARLAEAAGGLRDALDSAEKNFEGLGQTRRAGDLLLLVIRPQEVVAAVQALAQAYADFYGAVADYNRAQFRLYRALGAPAQLLAEQAAACSPPVVGISLEPAEDDPPPVKQAGGTPTPPSRPGPNPPWGRRTPAER